MPGRDWLLVILGAVGFIVLSHQVPILRQLGNSSFSSNTISLETIEGVDIRSLTICREKGLI